MGYKFDTVAFAFVKVNYYRIYWWCVCKDEAINMMKNSGIKEKSGT